MKRRTLIKSAGALPVVSQLACDRIDRWDGATLHAVTATMLPTLSGDGWTRHTHQFTAWAANITAVELNHGYGTGDIQYRDELPIDRWSGQLAALKRLGFSDMAAEERQSTIATQLAEYTEMRLPPAIRAPHIAIAVLSFFANSAEGADLAYRASIKKQSCRPLQQSAREPVQLPEDA